MGEKLEPRARGRCGRSVKALSLNRPMARVVRTTYSAAAAARAALLDQTER